MAAHNQEIQQLQSAGGCRVPAKPSGEGEDDSRPAETNPRTATAVEAERRPETRGEGG